MDSFRAGLFQSTPLPTGRSDYKARSDENNFAGFNPRPSQPEGATERIPSGQPIEVVSIHAPPNRKERHRSSSIERRAQAFQSTPLPTGRSDAA